MDNALNTPPISAATYMYMYVHVFALPPALHICSGLVVAHRGIGVTMVVLAPIDWNA